MVAAILACAFFVSTVAAGAERVAAKLPGAGDLKADAVDARERHVPILLFFNRAGCVYCERALREYLGPMHGDPAYAGRVLFRQVEIDKPLSLVDFGGRATTHREFAARYKVRLTPTIWFVDGDGTVLAEPIVGLPTIDFFGAYIDQRIGDSQALLRP